MSSLLKQRISSPLEAGPSILDSQNIPTHLTQALEYASKRLARKAIHISLIVVRKDHQLPTSALPCASPPASPEFSWSSGPLSPTRLTSQVAGLRQLVRRGTGSSVSSTSTTSFSSTSSEAASSTRGAVTSPTFASTPATPCTPATPYSVTTCTSTSSSSSTSSTASAGGPNPFGVRLIHATSLTPREEYHLRRAIIKAERKFQTGTGFLPPPSSASSCGLNRDLVRRCLRQNEVLFSAEGLTLLGLDRLYAFKSALAAYARTTLLRRGATPTARQKAERESRIEDAVDELRRLVLARGGRRLERSELYGAYEWIGVSAGALGDVERMYRRAYGGAQQIGAFDEVPPPRTPRTPAHNITVHFDRKSFEEDRNASELPLKLNVVKIGKPPSPKAHTPVLKLKTSFDTTSAAGSTHKSAVIRPLALKAHKEVTELAIRIDALDDNEQPQQHNEGDVTARPMAPGMSSFWNGIDELLAPKHESVAMSPVIQRLRASQQSRLGPATPNGYDDISPITRGEWGFLTTGKGWTGGRTAAVETC
ncbi:hypothetical protein E8E14_009946 [Neopestalotiopsis sp. 37M]|nr:hypothetical protein E8E14_009946 [Neopestalotiopsis sp. 37M]